MDLDIDMTKFNLEFRERKCCPVVYVDIPTLKAYQKVNLDLIEPLNHFESWLRKSEPYSPEVVIRFYCNIEIFDIWDKDENIVGNYLTSSIKSLICFALGPKW